MLIKLTNISKIYKLEGIEVKALDNVSLSVNKGEFVALIGPSGSGKSTLMHILGMLDKPTSGTYFLEEHEVSKFDENESAKIRNQKIGFVFQSFNLLSKTPAIEQVKLPALYSDNKKNLDARAQALLERVGLGERLHNRPSQLSGGQQQRVAIARALMNEPSIIFADEPTGNLDSKSGKEILQLLTDLNAEGKTVMLVTHDQNVANTAKRRITLKDGKIISDTTEK